MASIEQIKGSDGSGNASVATVQNSRSPGASTIIVDTVLDVNPAGFMGTMGTPHTFTDPITSETITVISEDTAVDFSGHVDGSNLEIDDIAPGYTDDGSEVGDIIIIRPTTQWSDNVAEVLEEAHNDDGSLKDDAVTEDVIADDAVTNDKVANNAVKYPQLGAGATRLGLGRDSGRTLTTAYVTHATVTATSNGGVCEAEFTLEASNLNSGTYLTMDVQVLCDGVAITPASISVNLPYSAGANPYYTYSFIMSSTPAAGSHTWNLQAKCNANTSGGTRNNFLKIAEVV